MNMPMFRPKQNHREWIRDEKKTAEFIRAFWAAASPHQRKTPEFLWFLALSSWTNVKIDKSGVLTGAESTRKWRNSRLAEYLDVEYQTIRGLAEN